MSVRMKNPWVSEDELFGQIQELIKNHTMVDALPKANHVHIMGMLQGIPQCQVDEDDSEIDSLVNYLCGAHKELRNLQHNDLSSLIHDIVNFIKGNSSEAVARCAALINIPILFRENLNSIVMTQEEAENLKEPEKIIILRRKDVSSREDNMFLVTVENNIVCKSPDLVSAVVGLMMAVYCFNCAYPKKFEKTLLFCQRVFLQLDDELPIDKKILHETSMLNQEMN